MHFFVILANTWNDMVVHEITDAPAQFFYLGCVCKIHHQPRSGFICDHILLSPPFWSNRLPHTWGCTPKPTSAFLRLKLGEALARRRVAPHIFETADEAHTFVEAADTTNEAGNAA